MSGTKQPETLIARLLRALSGLSQAMFGKKTGRSPVLIDEWEQGSSLPGEPDLAALAELGAGISRDDAGRRLLAEARQRFGEEGLPYDVALCLLEEAGLLLAAGRTREVKALTLELTGVFQSKGVHHEARKALRLFQQAVETDAATAGLVRDLLAYLFLARHDEGKRFEA